MLSEAIVRAMRDDAARDVAPAIMLLIHIQEPLARRAKTTGDPNHAPEFPELDFTTQRVWHDRLKSIVAIRAKTSQQTSLKKSAERAWRSYGYLFLLKEGRKVTTLEGPSIPSEERLYWKIPKRCFHNACSCAAVEACHHRLRACKGCWRVLYCSPQCQDL